MAKAGESLEIMASKGRVWFDCSRLQETYQLRRLDVFKLFELGEHLGNADRISKQESPKRGDVFFSLYPVREAFNEFVANQSAFDWVKPEANNIVTAIDVILRNNFYEPSEAGAASFRSDMDFDSAMPGWNFFELKVAVTAFKNVFSAECRRCETYFIGSRKLGYDTEMLLHNADDKIHDSIKSYVPLPALVELKAAGRCLALESYTASGRGGSTNSDGTVSGISA